MDLIRSLTCISASHLRIVRDDDSHVDRLSHRYTVAICVIFAIIVTTKQYAGDPIDCWVPAQFKASYEKYADSYCWIAGSWYTPMDKELPLSERERRQHRIRYYQWVPFLLLFQAILFYIPRIIWRTLNVRSGLDIVNLVDAAIKYESVDKFSDREKIMEYLTRNIERYIGARRSRYERLYGRQLCNMHKSSIDKNKQQQKKSSIFLCCSRVWIRLKIILSTVCFWTGKRLGNYLVVLYMFVKTLWLTNAVSQLFLLNRFIGNDYHAFGIEIIEMLLSGQEWHELRHFPRVTYCDFKIREIGNSHDWTVQCVLRINLFNEVIYIFMWFWLCILAICSAVDYATWALRIVVPGDKLKFVKRHLDIYNYYLPSEQNTNKQRYRNNNNSKRNQQMSDNGHDQDYSNNFEYVDVEKEKKLMREFTFNYLKDDGVFAMRILASSASDLIVTEVISELWKNFRNNYVEPCDEETLVSSPSSSSSSSTSSHQVSPAVSPSSNLNGNLNTKKDTSPNSFVKKPFILSQKQYTNTSQTGNSNSPVYPNKQQIVTPNSTIINFNNQNRNNTSSPLPNQTQATAPMPPVGPPPLTNINNNDLDSNNQNKKLSFSGSISYSRENTIYPQVQQRHIHHTEHSSSANPNAKDTHV